MQGQQQAEMDDAQKQFYTAQQRPLDLIGQFSTGVVSSEREVVTTGASLAGINTISNVNVGGTSGGGSNY